MLNSSILRLQVLFPSYKQLETYQGRSGLFSLKLRYCLVFEKAFTSFYQPISYSSKASVSMLGSLGKAVTWYLGGALIVATSTGSSTLVNLNSMSVSLYVKIGS